jgi:hypothetical protein
MKNFLIVVLALGLAGSAFLTRPDREEFERFLQKRQEAADPAAASVASSLGAGKVEVKDYYLWSVVRQDGKTLYTGVLNHWVDNEQVRRCFPSS